MSSDRTREYASQTETSSRGPLAPALLAASLTFAYLALPGHPLGWLSGIPLGPSGLAVLVLFGLVLFAAWPLSASRGVRRLAWLLAGLCAVKLIVGLAAPAYGLQASYYGKLERSPRVERSTDFRGLPATRLDRVLSFEGDTFPLYFFNDLVRFNYYRDDQPERESLPFEAVWSGLLDLPRDDDYRFWLSAVGTATLRVGDGLELRLQSPDRAQSAESTARLPRGQLPVHVEYARRGGAAAQLSVEWNAERRRTPLAAPYLLAAPSGLPSVLSEPLLWLSRALDALFLLSVAGLAAIWLRPVLRAQTTLSPQPSPKERRGWGRRLVRLERPLLALVLMLVFTHGALTSRDLDQHVVILEGGEDWLTYETYARDIQLDGPLMTLGRAIGKGRPFFFQPFYPYALATAHWLIGEDLYGVVVLQVFGIGLAGVFVYLLGKRLFGPISGLAGMFFIIGVLGPFQLDWVARKLLSENIYFWLLPATALSLVAHTEKPSSRLGVLAGVLLGLCCVTRGPTLLWVPPALLFTYSALKRKVTQADRSAALILTALVGISCLLVVSLVPLRNWIVSGEASLVATNGMATMDLAHPVPPTVDLTGVERNPVYRKLDLDFSIVQMIEFVRQDPLGYARTLLPLGLYAVGLPQMLEPGSSERWELIGLVGLYLAYLSGLTRAVSGRPRSAAIDFSSPTMLLHSFVWLHLLMMMVFLPNVYGYRQVLPMYLFLAVFAGQVVASGMLVLASRLRGGFQLQPGNRPQSDDIDDYVPRTGAPPRHEELA